MFCALFLIHTASAQQSLWLSATTSTAQPPADVVDANAATYLLLGLHGDARASAWDLDATFDYGSGFNAQAGRWGDAQFNASRSVRAKHASAAVNMTLNGLQYTSPFSYGSYSAQIWPAFSLNTTSFTATLTPQASVGVWSGSGQSSSITVFGSSISLEHDFRAVTADINAETHHARNGTLDGSYSGVGADIAATVGSWSLGGGVKSWHAPNGNEFGYDAYASKNIGATVRLDFQIARSTTDPVLATPGSFGASVALNWRIANRRAHEIAIRRVAAPGAVVANGRRVHFTVTLPDAHTVALSGTFSEWKPIDMQRTGNDFGVDVVVPAGTHQYGFLVDGQQWYLPPDATGVVDDGFGRKNATLVVQRP